MKISPSKTCRIVVSIIVSIEMRKSSAKGVVTSCPIGELEEYERWQLVDPFDMTTGARLLHSNNSSSNDEVNDDEDNVNVDDNVRKRKQQTKSPKIKKKRKNTS